MSGLALDSNPSRSLRVPTPSLDLILLGVGVVGGHLLHLLERRDSALHPKLRLAAVANSRRMRLAPQGLDPARIELADGEPLNLARLQHLAWSLPHPVLVDCTSSETVVEAYAAFAEAGCAIATANKKLASGPLPRLRRVQRLLQARGQTLRNETNVGAGLPVLSTLRDLQAGGDKVQKVEGILSGSLSFLCGLLEEGVPFSHAVAEAKALGYTEPDPRDDLSGLDVARKALILHRELGGSCELDEVPVEGLLPAGFEGGSVADFMARCRELDEPFQARVAELAARGEVLRVVGEADAQGARVRLRALGPQHPLRAVRDGENALAFTSEAYQSRPLVVRGYGAGAAVTAIGLLADLLKLEVGR